MNKVIKSNVIINDNILNLSQKVDSEVQIQTPRWIYQLHKSGKLHYDRERLQRLLNHWPELKANSYLTTLFNGLSQKDTIQLARIDTIVEKLKQDLSVETDSFEIEFLEENLQYFQNLLDEGKSFLVLDGQHRIDEIVKFFDDQRVFKPTTPVVYQFKDKPGRIYVKGLFSKLDESIQDYLFDSIPLITVIYNTGDLQELARIFITSNSMVAMSNHEKRILNYNPINRWLVSLCNYDTNIRSMFLSIGSGMTGDYDVLKKKGDTLFTAEMLLWINNNNYEHQEFALDEVLGPRQRDVKNPLKISISNTDKDITKKIMKIMADGCALYEIKKLKKFGKSSLYNFFYTLAYLIQKGNIWGSQKGIDGKYEVNDLKEFTRWFFDKEFERINAKGTYYYYKILGKNKKQMHDYSFAKHNADQKHSGKKSMKGQGGSKYSFPDYARLRYLLEDLNESINDLVKIGALKKVGSRKSNMSRDEFLVAHNVKLSESDNLHLDELDPVSKGGDRTLENTRFVDSKTNINDSNRIKRII